MCNYHRQTIVMQGRVTMAIGKELRTSGMQYARAPLAQAALMILYTRQQ